MELLIILGTLATIIAVWAFLNDKKRQEEEMLQILVRDAFEMIDELEAKAKKKAAPKKKAVAKKKAAPKKKAVKKAVKKRAK